MQTVYELKEQALTDTPILVFDCTLSNGQTEHWSTHAITIGATAYQARVLEHSAFEIQTASDQGVDGSPRISILLANADSHFSEIERSCGWKGARITAGFLFYDLRNEGPASETVTLFQGICNPPDEIREATFRVTAVNRMNLQRLVLPPIRIQRRCPWQFPESLDHRTEGLDGGAAGRYSLYYRCGYSPDIAGGCGAMNSGAPFASCGYTRADCQARGMQNRFGGIEFVPPAIPVRAYGKDWTASAVSVNQARYNDFVPMVYGTAWYTPPVVFARNDGNLTRMEVLLGVGPMHDVLKVLVNDVEIPLGVAGTDMTGTGWYNVPTLGGRDGAFDNNFLDGTGHPAGDPYGSMAYLAVVVPTRLSNGTSLPSVKVLAQGLVLPAYGMDGTYTGDQFSANPAWILLDILRRSGWAASEIDVASFAAAAGYCEETINATDLNGNSIMLPRFECNLVLQNRRSGGDVVRGIRNAARLYLTYGPGGLLQLQVENTLALERPVKPANSNSTIALNDGWPSYEFGDGSSDVSGILRKATGEPAIFLSSRSSADTPNRLTVEFQDSLNGYQQDSYSLVDPDDVARAGQEVSAALPALGLPNYNQAARILKCNLDKSVQGNAYVTFDTSVKAIGMRPGDLITLTYLKEGFNRQPFRVLKISPATNYRTATITAQIHDDAWYSDTNGQDSAAAGTARRSAAGVGTPRPLVGSVLDSNGDIQFGIEETATVGSDGTAEANVAVSFVPPPSAAGGPGIPLISLAATIGSGGTLQAGQTLYYAVSGLDVAGNESGLSFVVRAAIASDGCSVTLTGLSFPQGTSAFDVYRGITPAALFRVATNQALAGTFADTGLPNQLIAPPDANFDHANFYWRMELEPESSATLHGPTTIGNATLGMAGNRYRGMTARITRGRGRGEERPITSNDATSLTVAPPWVVEPDATSFVVVSEAGWRFGALSASSPVQFAIPNRSGQVVQITGRAANVNDAECAPELSIVTRWQIGGSGIGDSAAPPLPSFGLAVAPRGGGVELSGVSFSDLTNTRTISAATLTLHYWDELQGLSSIQLANSLTPRDLAVTLNAAGGALPGSFIQIEAEVLRVEAVANIGLQYTVTRGMHGTTATAHPAQSRVYHLLSKTAIAPFPPEFFGSAYSGSWSFPVPLVCARVASAELFVTNGRGNSPVRSISLMGTVDNGLRTLSGRQINLTLEGVVAVESNAVPPATLPQASSIRDLFATIGQPPMGSALTCLVRVNGMAIGTLTIAPGQIVSNAIDMSTNPSVEGLVIPAEQPVTLDITAVGSSYPGKRLMVTIRL